MGLLDVIFGRRKRDVRGRGWQTLSSPSPSYAPFQGEIWEKELTRACIERFATACGKLKPEIQGDSKPRIRRAFESDPNDMMTWPAFLKRLSAIYEADGTAFVVPQFASDGTTVTGLFPLRCEFAEIVDLHGEPWVRFNFRSGDTSAIELSNVAIISKFQVIDDMFGEPNCLGQTLSLLSAQDDAQRDAIANGARIRFIGKLEGMVREKDMREKRDRFMADNFSPENTSGFMLYDSTFSDVRQVDPQSYVMDSEEIDRIRGNVFDYFGINEAVLQNKFDEDGWGAWYESKVEPFAVSLGEALTRLLFSVVERRHGNRVMFSANRLEYASNPSKRNMVRDMVDRGIFTLNEAREVLQLPPIPGGDIRVIRGEYINAATISTVVEPSAPPSRAPMNAFDGDSDLGGHDKFYKPSDKYGSSDTDY